MFSREKKIMFPQGVGSWILAKKLQGIIFKKLNVIYVFGKISKFRYIKWSCILDLKVWIKSYDEKKVGGQISLFDPWLFFSS